MTVWQAIAQVKHILEGLTWLDEASKTDYNTAPPAGEPCFANVRDTGIPAADLRKRVTMPIAVVRHESTTDDPDDPRIGTTILSVTIVNRNESNIHGAASSGLNRPDGFAGSRGRGTRELADRVKRRFQADASGTPPDSDPLGVLPNELHVLAVTDGKQRDVAAGDNATVSLQEMRLKVITFAVPVYPRPSRGAVTGGDTLGWRGLGISDRYDFMEYEIRENVGGIDEDDLTITDGDQVGVVTGESIAVSGGGPWAIFARYCPFGDGPHCTLSLPPLVVQL